jgi:hypothetical protein
MSLHKIDPIYRQEWKIKEAARKARELKQQKLLDLVAYESAAEFAREQ